MILSLLELCLQCYFFCSRCMDAVNNLNIFFSFSFFFFFWNIIILDLNSLQDVVILYLGNRLFPYGREAMNVALRQLTEQYAAQPMIRYVVAVTSSS